MGSWDFFRLSEFDCKHCGANRMDPRFISRLDELRRRHGRPMVISSGYRCAEHNQRVSTTGPNGPHTTGRAVDVRVDRGDAYRLLALAITLGFTGIGVHQRGEGRFLHLDDLEQGRPTVWSY